MGEREIIERIQCLVCGKIDYGIYVEKVGSVQQGRLAKIIYLHKCNDCGTAWTFQIDDSVF